MPDQFGFETPQEAAARIQQQFQESQQAYVASQGGSAGARAGAALSAIFAPTLARTLSTMAERKDRRDVLMAEGLSEKEAKQRARVELPVMNKDVRRAEQIETLSARADDRISALVAGGLPHELATGIAMGEVADTMKSLGLTQQAAALRQQSAATIKSFREDQLRISGLKADISKTQAETEKLLDREDPDKLIRLQENRDVLLASLERNPEQPMTRKKLAEVEKAIQLENSRQGRTAEDLLAEGWTKPSLNELQGKIIDADMTLGGLTAIGEAFDPYYQTVLGRGETYLLGKLDKLGVPLTPAGKEYLSSSTAFKRDAIDALNRYIQSITGAAMSLPEAERIGKAFPNYEQGPVAFIAQLRSAVKQTLQVRKRAEFAIKNGPEGVLPSAKDKDDGMKWDSFYVSEQEIDDALGMTREAPATAAPQPSQRPPGTVRKPVILE